MKRQLAWMISGACAAALIGTTATIGTAADVMEKSVTSSSTTTYRGTVSEIAPATSTIILKSESAPEPVRYIYTEKTVFVDPAGKVVSREEIRGKPVTVEYTKEGDRQIVTKVIVTQPEGGVVQKRETTTETIH
jgi:hypothetical protein